MVLVIAAVLVPIAILIILNDRTIATKDAEIYRLKELTKSLKKQLEEAPFRRGRGGNG